MAALTTVITDPGVATWFDLSGMPSNLDPGEQPIGKITHRGQDAIDLTGATDTMAVTIACELPKGFAYKVTKMGLLLQTVSQADAGEWEIGAGYEFDADGDDVWISSMQRHFSDELASFNWLIAATLDWQTEYSPWTPFSQLWSGEDLTQVFLRLNNISGSATAASSIIHHVETQIFTIEQIRRPYIHRSQVVD